MLPCWVGYFPKVTRRGPRGIPLFSWLCRRLGASISSTLIIPATLKEFRLISYTHDGPPCIAFRERMGDGPVTIPAWHSALPIPGIYRLADLHILSSLSWYWCADEVLWSCGPKKKRFGEEPRRDLPLRRRVSPFLFLFFFFFLVLFRTPVPDRAVKHAKLACFSHFGA